MKCLSFRLYCTASVLAMAWVVWKVTDDDPTLNLFLAWRRLTMIRSHYFVFANFLAMFALVVSLGALRFFFGPIKEGEKIVGPSEHRLSMRSSRCTSSISSSSCHPPPLPISSVIVCFLTFLVVGPMLSACVHWVLIKRLKHLAPNP